MASRSSDQTSTATSAQRGPLTSYIVIVAGMIYCASSWRSPAVALALGMIAAILGLVQMQHIAWTKLASRILLQAAVVLLGFKMDLHELARAGSQGLAFACGTIVLVFVCGAALARWLRTSRNVTLLVSSGTAICGGSAIAAVGPVIGASSAEMSVAIGTVFLLNAAGLFLLPEIGQWLHLSQHQFGTWAAVSIHDVSSVTGAAARYGSEALAVATAVKLSRAIWIAPIAAIAGWWVRRCDTMAGLPPAKAKFMRMPVPPFILMLVAMSSLRTLWPQIATHLGLNRDGGAVFTDYIQAPALALMAMSLFLIGLALNRATLRSIGWRALVLGILLWIIISVVSVMVIMHTID